MIDRTTLETDVLIVGAGPAGATAALALGRYGISTICLSKYGSTSKTPRAHITNQRTMEVLRHFGLEPQAVAVATPQHLMREHVYCTSLAGVELGRMEAWHTHPRSKAQHDLASPCSLVDLTQEMLEPILVGAAMRAGSRVRFDSELTGFTQLRSALRRVLGRANARAKDRVPVNACWPVRSRRPQEWSRS